MGSITSHRVSHTTSPRCLNGRNRRQSSALQILTVILAQAAEVLRVLNNIFLLQIGTPLVSQAKQSGGPGDYISFQALVLDSGTVAFISRTGTSGNTIAGNTYHGPSFHSHTTRSIPVLLNGHNAVSMGNKDGKGDVTAARESDRKNHITGHGLERSRRR